MKLLYQGLLALSTLICLYPGTMLAQDYKLPSGRLEFTSTSFGLVVGFNRGEGSLRLPDRAPDEGYLPREVTTYPFSVSGFSLATVGVSKVDAVGVIYNLKDIGDFEGRYVAGEGGFTVGLGGGHVVMRNQKGVVILLQLFNLGAELKLGGGAINFTLQKSTSAQPAS